MNGGPREDFPNPLVPGLEGRVLAKIDRSQRPPGRTKTGGGATYLQLLLSSCGRLFHKLQKSEADHGLDLGLTTLRTRRSEARRLLGRSQ
jgi:hypothetical protein